MIKGIIRKAVCSSLENRYRKYCVSLESQNMLTLELCALTKDEEDAVRDLWDTKDFLYHRMFKTFEGFDARYVSDGCFLPRVLRALNPVIMSRCFEEKSLYFTTFRGVPQPKALVRCIRGVYWDGKGNKALTENDTIKLLRESGGFIIKPTHDSTQGNNVRLVKPDEDIKQVLKFYGDSFIAQEVLGQSQLTARFNHTSLNTFRITTLNINGLVSLCYIMFRCGQKGSVTDNCGAGGRFCGVSLNGLYRSYAYDKYFQRHETTEDGVKFDGHTIPNMENIVNQVKEWHTDYLPHIGFVAWDIALDENDNPTMIEVNIRWPGIKFGQLCNGTPIFGDRTSEVIEFVKSHPLPLKEVISIKENVFQ